MFDNWYVVQVRTGKEEEIVKKCQFYIDPAILIDCFIPITKKKKKYHGTWHIVDDILFKDDIKEWEKSINVTLTVDNAEEGYKGNTGLVTKYIPELEIKDIENTAFVVVGPPIMMKFTVAEILKRGVAEENIWVSYERKMCCGLGKCGHCKMDDTYICLDGPVFNYTKAKNLVD